MRVFAFGLVSLLIACGGGPSSTKQDTAQPRTAPVQSLEQQQATTCSALCKTMGRCANDADWDNAACSAACAKTTLARKHLVAYDSCSAQSECSAFGPCMAKVKMRIRQEKTCNKVCERNNECVVQDAKKNMDAAKAKQHTSDKILRRNLVECMVECMQTPKTPGQIKGADICLAKTSCGDYTKCATGGSDFSE